MRVNMLVSVLELEPFIISYPQLLLAQ